MKKETGTDSAKARGEGELGPLGVKHGFCCKVLSARWENSASGGGVGTGGLRLLLRVKDATCRVLVWGTCWPGRRQ